MKFPHPIAINTPTWLSAAERNALLSFVEELSSASLSWAEIWLFGSRARGLSHAQSDLDVAVVCANPPDDVRAILHNAAWNAGLGSDNPAIEACVSQPISDPRSTLFLAREDAFRLI
jgi:hypothetical protein